jgi:vitamin-K-epoxide reductase (warfarin-sensitive)
MLYWILLLAVLGTKLSAYSLYVERRLRYEKEYVPLCDIRDNISCTKAFTSKAGHLAILPNSLYGIFFYGVVLLLTLGGYSGIIFLLSSVVFVFSLYLAYVSFVKMKNYCLVCCGVYLVNVLLLLCSAYWYFFSVCGNCAPLF